MAFVLNFEKKEKDIKRITETIVQEAQKAPNRLKYQIKYPKKTEML